MICIRLEQTDNVLKLIPDTFKQKQRKQPSDEIVLQLDFFRVPFFFLH